MTLKSKILAVALATLPASTISAQEAGETSINVGASIFGGMLGAGYRINPSFGVRGMLLGGIGYKTNLTRSGVDYALDGKLNGASVLADFYPTKGNWRVSGGMLYTNSSIDLVGTLSATNPYAGFTNGSVESKITFNRKYIPLVTTGYDWNFSGNWKLSGEVGAMFTNGATLTTTSATAAIQTQLDGDADIAGYKADAAKLKVLPFIALSVGYNF